MLGGHARPYRHLDHLELAPDAKWLGSTHTDRAAMARQRMKGMGVDVDAMSGDAIQQTAQDRARSFRDEAPTTTA
jgi:hypothetical protein